MFSLLKLQVEELGNSLEKLSERDRSFARSLCDQFWARGLSPKQEPWVAKLLQKTRSPAQAAVRVEIGSLNGVLALFAKAKEHLNWPAITLAVPLSTRSDFAIRLTVAGPQARVPGSINVTTAEKGYDGKRGWLGRVTLDGIFAPSDGRDLGNCDPTWADKVQVKLKALAADPAATATEHGRLTGNCCFCGISLTDERSTAMGYGPICADHYGLPWGERPRGFGCSAA